MPGKSEATQSEAALAWANARRAAGATGLWERGYPWFTGENAEHHKFALRPWWLPRILGFGKLP